MSENNNKTIAEVKEGLLVGISPQNDCVDRIALAYKLLCEAEEIEANIRLRDSAIPVVK